MCVDKEDFFRIQGSKSSRDKLKFLKTNVPLLNLVEYPFDELEAENVKTVQVCFSIYFRHGVVISENSQQDEWLYIIKSGTCKLVKCLKVDIESVNSYWKQRVESQRDEKLREIEFMFDLDKYSRVIRREDSRIRFGVDKNGTRQVFLELPKMKEGDIFGLNDTIFDRELDGYKCSLMLISEGVECVQISRRSFLKHLSPQAWFKLRVNSTIYPNDEYFINKYFNSFVWKDFKRRSLTKVRKDIEAKNNKNKSSI